MIFREKQKSQPIGKRQVWDAFQAVKKNGGSAGVDNIAIADIESRAAKYLYPLWNRMASGSYTPVPVREVLIDKEDGKKRALGIPTVLDRVAQEVIRKELEMIVEPHFSVNSFGYRPGKSQHQAVKQCEENGQKFNWAIGLDIKGFFDNIDHRLLIRAVKRFTTSKHILMYVKRWLNAPVQKRDGSLEPKQGKGTPQGGVISPLLANIFLHFAFDTWFEKTFPECTYERYADDIIIHCKFFKESLNVLAAVKQRMKRCKLEIKQEKSNIVYCKRNQKNHPPFKPKYVKFDFLGFTFQPRWVKGWLGKWHLGFTPAISNKRRKRIGQTLYKMKIHRMVQFSLQDIANRLEPKIRGWINYYGKFRFSEMRKVFRVLNYRLMMWVRNKYRRFRKKIKTHAFRWLSNIAKSFPNLFLHWHYGFLP
ncbi:MAG: group II intron reverse transcriptase/maturase [Bacteroidales bacterium]